MVRPSRDQVLVACGMIAVAAACVWYCWFRFDPLGNFDFDRFFYGVLVPAGLALGAAYLLGPLRGRDRLEAVAVVVGVVCVFVAVGALYDRMSDWSRVRYAARDVSVRDAIFEDYRDHYRVAAESTAAWHQALNADFPDLGAYDSLSPVENPTLFEPTGPPVNFEWKVSEPYEGLMIGRASAWWDGGRTGHYGRWAGPDSMENSRLLLHLTEDYYDRGGSWELLARRVEVR